MEDSQQSERAGGGRFDPWLAVIVVLTAIGGALIVSKARDWSVMPDELVYTEFARSIVHSVLPIPAIQGHVLTVFQTLFPTLIAPLMAIMSLPDAYPWIAVLNACLMASTAIPAYLLTNYVTESRPAARWVALCTAITPWLIFAAKVLPDAAAYVACTWAIYAIVRTAGSREHALRGDLLTLLAIVLAYLVRNQFLILLGIWAGTVVFARVATTVDHSSWRTLPRAIVRLLRDRPLPIFSLVFALLMVRFKPDWILGVYTQVATDNSNALPGSNLLQELINHANAVALGIAALPLVLGLPWLLSALTRVSREREFNAAIAISLATAVVIYVGANFDMRFDPTDRVIERYIFYLAPLWLTAMAAFFARPPKNVIAFAVPALAAALLLIATKPYGLDSELNRAINLAFSPTQIVLIEWQKAADMIGTSISGLLLILVALICAFCWWAIESDRARLARNVSFSVVALILLFGTLTTVPDSIRANHLTSVKAFGPRSNDQKRWVEIATDQQKYAIVYSRWSLFQGKLDSVAMENKAAWRDAAFWNRGLSATYTPDRTIFPGVTPLPGVTAPLKVNWTSGLLDRGDDQGARFLLLSANDPRFAPQTTAPPTRTKRFVLYPVAPEVYAAWYTRDLTARGWVPPTGATLRVWAPRGATGPTKMQVTMRVSTTSARKIPPILTPVESRVNVATVKRVTTYSWPVEIPAGGRVDFPLGRGAVNAHIDRITVTPLQRDSGFGR